MALKFQRDGRGPSSRIEVGMTLDDVETILGKAEKVDAYPDLELHGCQAPVALVLVSVRPNDGRVFDARWYPRSQSEMDNYRALMRTPK